jgi:hypothetical protein
MAKEPVLGRVKTRLGREIGPAQATRLYRATASAVLDRLAGDPRFETWLAMAPDVATASRTRALCRVRRRFGQGGGDLGQRLQRAAERAPAGPVLIIGTDIPEITPARVMAAFRALAGHDAVFGPAEDGGYWLVGLQRRPRTPRPFARVRWSSPHTLADTRANLTDLRLTEAAVLSDLDTAADLTRLARHVGRRILPASPVD